MSSLISIIMPVYNCEEYISQSIKSICEQTYKNWELIILNNCSTDKTVEIARKINDHRIKIITMDSTKGVVECFVEGLKYSNGTFIVRHDPDDISSPNRLEKQVEYLQNHEDIGMVSCLLKCFTNDPSYRRACAFIEKIQNNYITKEEIENCIREGFIPIIFSTLMIRRILFNNIKISKKINSFDDYIELLLELIKRGRVEKINKILYSYRRHRNAYHIMNEIEYENYVKPLLEDSKIKNFFKYRELYESFLSKKVPKVKLNENSKVRVLMVVDALNIGGTETHVLNLTKKLIEMGVYVVVATSGGPMEAIFEYYGIKVVRLPLKGDYISNKDLFGMLKLVKNIIDHEKINLLHCHLFASMRIGSEIYRMYKIPYITTIHGLFYPKDILYSTCVQASYVISISKPVKKYVNESFVNRIKDKLRIIPNGIDMGTFNPKINHNGIRKQLNIPYNAPVVTYCSRLDWGKTIGAEAFIFSLYQLAAKYKNIHGIIVGDGGDRNLIEREANAINSMLKRKVIHIVGSKFDVVPYYLDSNIVVGTGRVALEAMSCERPVIAVGNVGYAGIVSKENQKQLWEMYFGDHDALEKTDVSRLSECIDYLLKDPNKIHQLGMWARKWCKETFDNAIVAERTLELYKETL